MAGSLGYTIGLDLYKLGYQISPILLSGGILSGGLLGAIPGGLLPIVALTEPLSFLTGILSGGTSLSLDNFFAHFEPLPGGTIVDNEIGTYSFANQSVAANAIIAQPLRQSFLMKCPAKGPDGTLVKSLTFLALQKALELHNSLGGLYVLITPTMIYTGCIMTRFSDASAGETKQRQYQWQLDFVKPLVTLEQADQAQNMLMNKISSLTEVDDLNWSGTANADAQISGATPVSIPQAQPYQGSGIATLS